jgi:hypothetical protein
MCFRPQVREKPTLLGPLERASLSHRSGEQRFHGLGIHEGRDSLCNSHTTLSALSQIKHQNNYV